MIEIGTLINGVITIHDASSVTVFSPKPYPINKACLCRVRLEQGYLKVRVGGGVTPQCKTIREFLQTIKDNQTIILVNQTIILLISLASSTIYMCTMTEKNWKQFFEVIKKTQLISHWMGSDVV